ncbi:MFS general substrate transporter [Thozetella sp. PMI_491]|nr:MFS general substrate transporter [Thozetella sp. PMI_491]
MTSADENTPLLPNREERKKGLVPRFWATISNVETRVLFTGLLISLSFSYTQVPIFYVFHLMECDVYYSTHPPYTGTGDRCSINEITAGTATQFSLLGMSTTFFGVMNLFVAGWTVKKVGPRLALMLQTTVASLRVCCQIVAVMLGGRNGIIIFQATQAITIIGGPVGYVLILNIIASEVVEPMRRTSLFGRLQGSFMLGQGIGQFVGGTIGNTFGIQRPFEVAFCNLLFSSLFVSVALPYISPSSMADGKSKVKGIAAFFAPLKVLRPQKLRLPDGTVKKHYGVLFLCSGVFIGVVATGWVAQMIQMYATASFGFTQGENAILMSGYALMRALFLMTIFPRIIDWGRAWYVSDKYQTAKHSDVMPAEISSPSQLEAPIGTQQEQEPVEVKASEDRAACRFDLFFLRWSLLVDGALTTISAFGTQGWHMYLASFMLPFGSGTAPAAKGVITEMCPSSQRPDALNALTLVENIARLTTQGFFGFVFAALAGIGKTYLTFFVNAAVAFVGMGILLLSHFPPLGSSLIEDVDDDRDSEGTVVATDSEE